MKFTVEQKALKTALNLVGNLTNSIQTLDSLTNYALFRSDSYGRIKITTSNQNTTLITALSAKTDVPVNICIPFKQLYKLIDLLTGNIEFTEDKGWIRISCGNSRHRLPARPGYEFPEIRFESLSEITVNGDLFQEMMNAAAIASSKQDQARFLLNAINLKVEKDELIIQACDGTQACIIVHHLVDPVEIPIEILLSLTAVAAITKICKAADNIILSVSQNQIQIQGSDGKILSRLLSGTFPDVSSVFPDSNPYVIEVNPTEMANCLKRALLSSGEFGTLNIKLTNKEFTASSKTETGLSEETLDVNCPAIVDFLEWPVAGTQIINALNLTKESVKMSFSSPTTAILIEPAVGEYKLRYISMPKAPKAGDVK